MPKDAKTAEDYDRLAAKSRSEAAAATLTNIRERALSAAAQFEKLANGVRAMDRRRATGRWLDEAERQRKLVQRNNAKRNP